MHDDTDDNNTNVSCETLARTATNGGDDHRRPRALRTSCAGGPVALRETAVSRPRPWGNGALRTSCAGGPCVACGVDHVLGGGDAERHAVALMDELEASGCLDFALPATERDPDLALTPLWGDARGKMFGVLVCIDVNDTPVVLKAFSGQYQGRWEVPGWVPPLFDVNRWEQLVAPIDREIKTLDTEIAVLDAQAAAVAMLRDKRRALSQALMRDIHGLYDVCNLRGEHRTLAAAFVAKRIPTGAGDCCAPKLLNAAARQGLRPVGIAEFFWGRENASQTRMHRRFYPSCADKCRPLLGFMLCGSDRDHDGSIPARTQPAVGSETGSVPQAHPGTASRRSTCTTEDR